MLESTPRRRLSTPDRRGPDRGGRATARSRQAVPDPGLPLQAFGTRVGLEVVTAPVGGLHHGVVRIPLRKHDDLVRLSLRHVELLAPGSILLERLAPFLERPFEPFDVRDRDPELDQDHVAHLLEPRRPCWVGAGLAGAAGRGDAPSATTGSFARLSTINWNTSGRE